MNTSIKPSTASIAKGQREQNRLRPAAQRSLPLVGRRDLTVPCFAAVGIPRLADGLFVGTGKQTRSLPLHLHNLNWSEYNRLQRNGMPSNRCS